MTNSSTGYLDKNGEEIFVGDEVYLEGIMYEVIINDFNGEPVIDNDFGQEKLQNVYQNCIKA